MITEWVLIVAAASLPYIWGELTYRLMNWMVPRDDGRDASDAAEPATRRDVLDFQI